MSAIKMSNFQNVRQQFNLKQSVIAMLLIITLFSCGPSNDELKKQGDKLVRKIEQFKKENGRLPNRLNELGIEEKMEGPLYYVKWDSVNYEVYFGLTLGESMTYYSDTKEWSEVQRGMGDKK